MRKGLVFSMDAMLAVILLILVASTVVFYTFQGHLYSEKYHLADMRAQDEAIINFYTDVSSEDVPPVDFYACSAYLTYDPNNGSTQAIIGRNKACAVPGDYS